MTNSIDQQFVEFIAKSLVSEPDEVKVERRIDERGVLLELTVAPVDLGRVIGKHGATAQSLRTLLRALGTKNDARYNLKIVDSDQPQNESRAPSDERRDQEPVSAPAPQDDSTSSDDDQVVEEESPTTDDQQTAASEDKVTEDDSRVDSNQDSLADKTRRELAELDDLDV